MKWLFDLFKRLFGSKQPHALPQGSYGVETDWYPPTSAATFDIKDAIIASARALAEERHKKETELLSDEKVREYFIKTFSALVAELYQDDHYDFVLIAQNKTGVPNEVYPTFRSIFYAACQELGLTHRNTTDCVCLNKAPLKKFLDSTDAPRIDIDEKVRALLHTGVYR